MRRRFATAVVLIALYSATAHGDVLGVPVPRGTRAQPAAAAAAPRPEPPAFTSGRGFRDTVDFYRRWLTRQGLPHQAIPVAQLRGVDVARFLSRDDHSPWLAIHVFRVAGTTQIVVVPRPSAPADPPSARPARSP